MPKATFGPFNSINFISYYSSWQSAIDIGGVTSAYFYPISGYDYRIDYFLHWQKAKGHKQSSVLDLNIHGITDDDGIEDFLKHTKTSLVIKPAEKLLLPPYHAVFSALLEWSRVERKGLIFVFEAFPSQVESELVSRFHRAFQNYKIFPLLSKKDTFEYIHYLEKKWDKECDINSDDIFAETGGHMWLTKEIVRQNIKERLNLLDITNSRVYEFKVHTIISILPSHVKEILHDIALSKSVDTTTMVFRDILEMRFVDKKCYSLTPKFLRAIILKDSPKLSLKNERLILRNVDVTHAFSIQEKIVITSLLTSKSDHVSRENVAHLVWPSGTYTDWAFDRLISRIRKKLSSLDIDPNNLVVTRNKGLKYVQQ